MQLATLVDHAPAGDEWIHEIKFDGYRMLCRVDKGKATFISRNGKEWTKKFDELPAQTCRTSRDKRHHRRRSRDPRADGRTSFQALQNAFNHRSRRRFCSTSSICSFSMAMTSPTLPSKTESDPAEDHSDEGGLLR